MILRVAWNCRCRYEGGQHVAIGLLAGLLPEEITRLAQSPTANGWSARQSALLQAVDDLHQQRMMSDVTWRRLCEHFDERRLIEISMLIGDRKSTRLNSSH